MLNEEQIERLESKLQEMSIELDTMISSRNYYKDQCESLLVSLANSVQNHVPAYRTQKEVEEMIESVEAQQKAKRQKVKQKCNQQINDYRKTIDQLNNKIMQQEKVFQDQEDVRVGLIEKLMFYKKSLSEASSLQQETEIKLSQLKSSESITIENNDSELINELKATHENEINAFKVQIKKLRKKMKYLTNSLEITQTANDESNIDLKNLNQQIKDQKQIEQNLKKELTIEKQKQIDAASLIKIAISETEQMQKESIESSKRIQILLRTINEQEQVMEDMRKSMTETMIEAQQTKEKVQSQNKEILDFHMKVEELSQQKEAIKDKFDDDKSQLSNKIMSLEETINKLKKKILEMENDRNELQTTLNQKMLEVNQENRLRKAAELAKETALTNLKNAYALMNTNESARHETNIEVEKLANDLETKTYEHNEVLKKVDIIQNQLDISQMQLNSEKEKNKMFSSQINKLTAELEEVKSGSIWKVDAFEQTEQLRNEKIHVINELNELQQQFNIIVSENETKEITLKHQEEILRKNVLEFKNIQRQNRQLRKKLQQSGFSSSIPLENSNDNNISSIICQNCEKLQEQIKIIKLRCQRLSDDLTSNEMIMNNARNEIRNFIANISDMVLSDEISPRFMELRAKLEQNSLTFQQELLEFDGFIAEFIDDLVCHHEGQSSTEAKLLKSTISHMQNKISTLQVQNKLQNEEISNLRKSMEAVSSKKEETEMKMSTMNESIGTFRKTLNITKKKLSHTQQTKQKLKNELTMAKIKTGKLSGENSQIDDYDQDLSDLSSVSSNHSKSSFHVPRAAKTTTLGDSLALLDLLCQ